MFSPSLFTKQQMQFLFDHSTKSPHRQKRINVVSMTARTPISLLGAAGR
jgi:hypothetical protein